MASFLEIKELLRDIFVIDTDMDEECDIIVTGPSYTGTKNNIVFYNKDLKLAYDKMQNYVKDKLEISTENYREAVLRFAIHPPRNVIEMDTIEDPVNELTYSVGLATPEYCMFLLDLLVENIKTGDRKFCIELRHRSRMVFRRNLSNEEKNNPTELLAELLRAYTIKLNSKNHLSLYKLRNYSASFEFEVMYKRNIPLSEYNDIQDMYSIGNSMFGYSYGNIETPPNRIYNIDVLDYYTMAMESRDPFTMYISFYHIIEHYFDAVFRKKLTAEMKQKITHPDFSYKNDGQLYELAKYIKKHMSNDLDSGKGNEFESLKYVLMEFVPIEELMNHLALINPQLKDYYQNNLVPFTTSKKTKIMWYDTNGVYTNLATRIYETRNALVHSKSEHISNQYRPYENKNDLMSEMALIKSVAELVLINSSEIL